MTKVVIGTNVNELWRFSECMASLMQMEKPEGTRYIQGIHGSLARALNVIGDYFMKSDATHLMLTNDDHIYPSDTLTRLLAHDKDIVGGIYLRRGFPFEPVVFDHANEEGRVRPHFLANGEHGLVPVKSLGNGCVLISRKVLEALSPPWWELGTIVSDLISEDLTFYQRAREAGFEVWCDLDVRVAHIAVIPVWPALRDGEWTTLLQIGGPTKMMALPTASKLAQASNAAAEDHR